MKLVVAVVLVAAACAEVYNPQYPTEVQSNPNNNPRNFDNRRNFNNQNNFDPQRNFNNPNNFDNNQRNNFDGRNFPQQQQPFQRQQQTSPYVARGWRPSGPQFGLPARQQQAPPANDYLPPPPPQSYGTPGTPGQGYGPPQQEYGPPETSTDDFEETTTSDPFTTTGRSLRRNFGQLKDDRKDRKDDEKESKKDDDKEDKQEDKKGNLKEAEELNEENVGSSVNQRGIYYIYHPTGLLQRVIFNTKDDVKNMAYTAQLKYQNVEPIREPIYSYDPKTNALQLLQYQQQQQ